MKRTIIKNQDNAPRLPATITPRRARRAGVERFSTPCVGLCLAALALSLAITPRVYANSAVRVNEITGCWAICQGDSILRVLYDAAETLLWNRCHVAPTERKYGALTQANGQNWCAIAINQDGHQIGVSLSKSTRAEAEVAALGFAGGQDYARIAYTWYNDLRVENWTSAGPIKRTWSQAESLDTPGL